MDYILWLSNYRNDIPEAGQPIFIKIHDIDEIKLKMGDGLKDLAHLPDIVSYPQHDNMDDLKGWLYAECR